MEITPLKDQHALLKAIIMSSDDAIISKSLDGVITSWNPAAVQMFGHTEEDAIGQHISLIIPADRLGEEDFIISQIKAGKQVQHFETFRKTKSDQLIPISVTISPVIDKTGNIIGASKIARDITERYLAQQEKITLLEQLEELNKRKDEFIALASHELRTPLTSMSAYLQILSVKTADDSTKMFVEKAMTQAQKLNNLISDLLDVSRIEAGKLSIKREVFELCSLIQETIDTIQNVNSDFVITFKNSLQTQAFIGDAHRIEQVIVNLLTNAIRYSARNNKIEVYLSKEDDNILIGVRDYGVGIESKNFEHIFSRFYRVDNADKISGLGLGLYLCHQIVTQHQGMIWVESEVSEGSTFWVKLPVVKC